VHVPIIGVLCFGSTSGGLSNEALDQRLPWVDKLPKLDQDKINKAIAKRQRKLNRVKTVEAGNANN